MRLVFENMEHVLEFGEGYVNELVIENRKMFSDAVSSAINQVEGNGGKFVLSINYKPVEFSRHTDITLQFAPFKLNRKSLITKLCTSLEQIALRGENYTYTSTLLSELEAYIQRLSDDFPFDIDCQKLAIGPIIRAVSPEIDEGDKSTLEKVCTYMELVRELDRDRLFIMINMRTYFSDEEMESFIQTVVLHDFKLLLLESTSRPILKNVKRFTVDEDLCEF